MATSPVQIHRRVLAFALGLPGAYEDHPWDETVAKVNKKVFVFLGSEESTMWPAMTVKLVESHEEALSIPGAEPTGYGLGKAGWVSASFLKGKDVPVELLLQWLEESYRAVAPKKSIQELDATLA